MELIDSSGNSKCELFVVATPIGNLSDLSLRAIEVLKKTSTLFCEDTRQARKLTRHLGIQPSLLRLDEHTQEEQIARYLEKNDSEVMAFVSDAGTPAISDPGARLVEVARKHGILVTPIPGASAVTTLISVSGFQGNFCFRGFFPRKTKDQEEEMRIFSQNDAANLWIWFESPRRIGATLEFLSKEYGNYRIFVAREMTKVYEEYYMGDIESVFNQVSKTLKQIGEKGEWALVIERPSSARNDANPEKELGWVNTLDCILEIPIPASEAAKRVSQYFGIAKNQVYEKALELAKEKRKKNDSGA